MQEQCLPDVGTVYDRLPPRASCCPPKHPGYITHDRPDSSSQPPGDDSSSAENHDIVPLPVQRLRSRRLNLTPTPTGLKNLYILEARALGRNIMGDPG